MLFTVIPKSVPPDTELIHHSSLITLFLISIISLPACFGSLLSPSQLCFYILIAVFYSPVKPRKLLQKTHMPALWCLCLCGSLLERVSTRTETEPHEPAGCWSWPCQGQGCSAAKAGTRKGEQVSALLSNPNRDKLPFFCSFSKRGSPQSPTPQWIAAAFPVLKAPWDRRGISPRGSLWKCFLPLLWARCSPTRCQKATSIDGDHCSASKDSQSRSSAMAESGPRAGGGCL